jgi:predicted PurR-regulated permease PerM
VNQKYLQLAFFGALMLVALTLTVFIFKPFFSVLFIAIVLAAVAFPFHQWVLKQFNGHKNISATVTTALVAILILIPVMVLTMLLIQQSIDILGRISSQPGIFGSIVRWVNSVDGFIFQKFNVHVNFEQYINVQALAGQSSTWFIEQFKFIFANTIEIILAVFLVVLALFFFLRDGKEFIRNIMRLSPLKDEHDEKVLQKMGLAITSVIRGSLIVSVIKGVLAGIGFYLFGIPGAIVLGFIAVIVSLLPSVGTTLLFLPFVIYGFFNSGWLWATGLLIWAVIIVSLVDNILGPIIMERGMKIHPMFIMFSLIGGLVVFGPVGFIVGPVVLSLLYALAEIYPLIITKP